jgi:hypothetical protein
MTTRKEINEARNEALESMVAEVTGPAKAALEAANNNFAEVAGRNPGAGNEGHAEWMVEAKAARQEMKNAKSNAYEAEKEMSLQDAAIRAEYRAMVEAIKA